MNSFSFIILANDNLISLENYNYTQLIGPSLIYFDDKTIFCEEGFIYENSVCLGHQAIAEYFGARLLNLDKVNHGISTEISIVESDNMFNSIPKKINVGLYHSWFVDKEKLPRDLVITSVNEKGNIYSLKHSKLDIRGVQFHPESIMTENGLKMIENWIKLN